jgi:hypothetical protein
MEGGDGESACRVPREGEGGIVSATVIHVEWTKEELLRIENGGLGGEGGLGGVVSTGRMIEH